MDKESRVVGIAVGTYRGGQNLNFAIPSDRLSQLIAKIGDVQPLSVLAKIGNKETTANSGSARNSSGVIVAHAECRKIDASNPYLSADCAYTIQNKLDRPVTNVVGIFIIWGKDREPFHAEPFQWNQAILPGLAVRRQAHSIDAQDFRLVGRVEARILDFRFAD